ncbi:hypothetical protein OSG_eHP28_00075 [environmental Halophage eHP-28]|nr:hypothetical protein OSG_eHP28_00075 [environmental Halophage eHP-28]
MERNITDLENSSKVQSIQRGVAPDWIVITDVENGPQPNVVDVFVDHTDNYEIGGKTKTESETIVHVNEVVAE